MQIVISDNRNVGKNIEVDFQLNQKSFNVYFKSDDALLTGTNEAFIACSLLPAMASGCQPLNAHGELSERFANSLVNIQNLYGSWKSLLKPLTLKNVTLVQKQPGEGKRVGSFFTGGVDSFYTFMKHKDEITDVIYVHGFDLGLQDTVLREKVSKNLRKIAAHFGKNVIEIETNLKQMLNRYVDWGGVSHGAALAAIGHLLGSDFYRIYIPATFSYQELFPWGSHPDLDPLWSTEALEFIHDGCEATRIDKIAFLVKHEIFLQNVRVCWKNPNSAYNCGACEKCLRTMITLRALGYLDACTAFDAPFDIQNVLKIQATYESARTFIKGNLQLVKDKSPADKELIDTLQAVLDKPQLFNRIKNKFKGTIQRYKLRAKA
jgi:hypothetical protein